MTIKHLGGIFGRNPTFNDVTIDGGIYIGGDAAGNLLDYYEEGTWTPALTGSSGGSATISTITRATYIRVGNLVRIQCYVSGIDLSTHTINGDVRVTGLPFLGISFSGVASLTFCNLFTFDEKTAGVMGYFQTNHIQLMQGSSVSLITDSELQASGTRTFMLEGVYTAS